VFRPCRKKSAKVEQDVVVKQQLGELLRGWRRRRGLSLGALAAQAGVAKGTLSGWERGLHAPRLPELEAVLTALEVPLAQRPAALALIDAPRGRRSLITPAAAVSPSLEAAAQPVPGHLLQALRLRRGLTLESAAREAGISRFAISRWERSTLIPSSVHLWKLLDLLDARPEERFALMSGQRLLLPLAGGSPPPLELLERRLEELEAGIIQGDRSLMDLEFLAWQAQIWPQAAYSAAAKELLALGWASYAAWLTWDDRRQEAGPYAARAIDLVRAEGRKTERSLAILERAVHVCGLVTAHGSARSAWADAVEWLQAWLPHAAGAGWEIALYRDMAENASWAGQPEAANAFADRACRLAEQLEDESAARLCRDVRADLFVRSGQPRKALGLLSPPEAHAVTLQRLLGTLRWVRMMRSLGEPAAAAWLAEAYALIERHGYPQFRGTADELAREL
jgi:transcriptional regulator with XRE-family HTH domain